MFLPETRSVQNCEFLYFVVFFFRKMNILWGGMMNMWIFLGYYHKTELFLGVISIPFLGLFLKDKVQNWNLFLKLLNFKYFLGYA